MRNFWCSKNFAKTFEAELALFINCFLIACQLVVPVHINLGNRGNAKEGKGAWSQDTHATCLSLTLLSFWLLPPASQQLVKSTFNLLHMAKNQLADTNAHRHPR